MKYKIIGKIHNLKLHLVYKKQQKATKFVVFCKFYFIIELV